MFNYAPISSIPFSLPGANVATAAKSSFSLSSIFSGIQKTATTINQIVPLYNNIKPIISNSKTLFNIMKGVAAAPPKQTQTTIKKEKEEPINVEIKEKTKDEKIEIKSINTPSSPFFNQ